MAALLLGSASLASATTTDAADGGWHVIVRQSVQITPGSGGASATYHIVSQAGVVDPTAAGRTARPNSTATNCPNDGSISVFVCGQINYMAFGSGTGRYAYTESWGMQAGRYDATAALQDLQWDGGQVGRCYTSSQCGVLNKDNSGGFQPSPGVLVTKYPSWGQIYTSIDQADFQCLNEDLQWGHGRGVYHLKNQVCVPTS